MSNNSPFAVGIISFEERSRDEWLSYLNGFSGYFVYLPSQKTGGTWFQNDVITVVQSIPMDHLHDSPALLVALFVLFIFIFQPTATSAFNILARSLFGLFIVVYFGLALTAMIHSYVKASAQERSKYGLNLMLIGVLIGLLPITIAVLMVVLAPTVVLPGSDFYFLTFILIPITLALATMKKEAAPAQARARAPLM